jgi:hypothetical protein
LKTASTSRARTRRGGRVLLGKSLDELEKPKTIADAMTGNWLEFFVMKGKELK